MNHSLSGGRLHLSLQTYFRDFGHGERSVEAEETGGYVKAIQDGSGEG